MNTVYSRKRSHADRVIRAYLTLRCNGGCSYCSAGVPDVSESICRHIISPKVWAEGINQRGRECILAGGEPFLYPGLVRLVEMLEVRAQIYTNLKVPVDELLNGTEKRLSMLVSLHPMNDKESAIWLANARKLQDAGHALRFSVVKHDDWQKRVEFIKRSGLKGSVTVASDQRSGIKSSGKRTNKLFPSVHCTQRIYLYGPDGYRYPCVSLMIRGLHDARLEHILEPDNDDWTAVQDCKLFGLCVGCDNNIEGEVTYKGESR